ncbi:MAG: Ig-like domain-containing protein [Gallionella sp.]
MHKITSVEPRKFNAKVLCCALGLMGVVSGGDARCNDARPDSMVQGAVPSQEVKTITFCRDRESLIPVSAWNSFSPINREFLQQIGKPYTGTVEDTLQYKVTLLELPKHGQAQLVHEPSQHWTYVPEKGYEGIDRVTYFVENQGKQYKVVINFWVISYPDEKGESQSQLCESIDFGFRGVEGGAAKAVSQSPVESVLFSTQNVKTITFCRDTVRRLG